MTDDEIQAKSEIVSTRLKRVATGLSEEDYHKAAENAEKLTEMDCSMCQTFGHHLGGLIMAANYAMGETTTERLREMGVDQATYIRGDIVEPTG